MHIAALTVYPVKGFRPLHLQRADVERWGLLHDRRWAVVGGDGRVLTQREFPTMARVDAWPEGAGLRIEAAGYGGADVRAEGPFLVMEIWRQRVPVRAANAEASAWIGRVLGGDCTLVYLEDPAARPVTPDLARPGDVVSLADGFPLLVATTGSLADLNRRLVEAVPMIRFRPNLVVEGAEAWAEDGWSCLETGPVRLRLASGCSRCKVITVDQESGERLGGLEPLKTLSGFRRDREGKVTFGWNAIPETLGSVSVGEAVTVHLNR